MKCRQHFFLATDSFERTFLSLASAQPVERKDPSLTNQLLAGRITVEEHILQLVETCERQGHPIDPAAPLLAVSCRNVLANARCGAWVRGQTASFITIAGESPQRAQRPYHVLGLKKQGLAMEEFLPHRDAVASFDWMISGVPVWWDGEPVFPRILTEASDPAHVFKLPRGGHPLATEQTAARWRRLEERFRSLIDSPREHAFAEMLKETVGLEREDDYLHNVIGITPDGQLRVLVANGRLESLGDQMAASGVRRALMVDNGGSSTVFFFPDGFRQKYIQLVAGLNYRPSGTAFLVLVQPR